eukprot:4706619-Pleurochrysis_carterae.AAC.3
MPWCVGDRKFRDDSYLPRASASSAARSCHSASVRPTEAASSLKACADSSLTRSKQSATR